MKRRKRKSESRVKTSWIRSWANHTTLAEDPIVFELFSYDMFLISMILAFQRNSPHDVLRIGWPFTMMLVFSYPFSLIGHVYIVVHACIATPLANFMKNRRWVITLSLTSLGGVPHSYWLDGFDLHLIGWFG